MTASIYLASTSPRRQELLRQIGIEFIQIPLDVDERQMSQESADTYVRRLALLKAREGLITLAPTDTRPVLGADTIVVLDGRIFGKPADETEAKNMLKALSGRRHQVMTAIALVTHEKEEVLLRSTDVIFRPLSDEDVNAYCQTGEFYDKAGAYALQGKGALFVEHIEGSYSGVVGLPLMETADVLARFGVSVLVK